MPRNCQGEKARRLSGVTNPPGLSALLPSCAAANASPTALLLLQPLYPRPAALARAANAKFTYHTRYVEQEREREREKKRELELPAALDLEPHISSPACIFIAGQRVCVRACVRLAAAARASALARRIRIFTSAVRNCVRE